MYLTNLELINFRNYKSVKLDFKDSMILIMGDNGQGKTNLLESIHYISSGKSHRTADQDELINWNSDYAILRASLVSSKKTGRNSLNQLIEIELRRKNYIKIKINGAYYRRKSDFTSIISSVIFSPDDLRIIKEGPSGRRDFLDDILEKLQSKYASERIHYQKILNQRNSLLKSIGSEEQANANSTIEAWDENLINYGSEIIKKRYDLLAPIEEKFIKFMDYFFPGINADISYIFSWNRNSQNLQSQTLPDKSVGIQEPLETVGTIGNIKEVFGIKLKQGFKKDLLLRTTFIGPHRDDLLITINGKDIRSFGSQGQQRIAAICLKLSELDVLRENLDKNPVLLLDDVLSELDPERKKLLVNLIGDKSQTFITTSNFASISDLDKKFVDKLLVKEDNIFL